ncbi:phosphotransferase, partial [Streptomyces sp. YS-3]|uniref:phosphotransferase n=1 Tax=Streptomyces sp. YS-3 TaxID=3381352 RepID=UPI003862CBAA
SRPRFLGRPLLVSATASHPMKLAGSLRRLGGAGGISGEDRRFLDERARRLQKEYDRLDFVLPFGMIHRDANVGNALRHRDGSAVLIDLDGFALAPREWDLVLTAMYPRKVRLAHA